MILAAVFIIFAGYLAVGFAGYLAYPGSVDSNVLKSFPMRPVLLKASLWLITYRLPVNFTQFAHTLCSTLLVVREAWGWQGGDER